MKQHEVLAEALYLALISPDQMMTRALCTLAARIAEGMTTKEIDACKKKAEEMFEAMMTEQTETIP